AVATAADARAPRRGGTRAKVARYRQRRRGRRGRGTGRSEERAEEPAPAAEPDVCTRRREEHTRVPVRDGETTEGEGRPTESDQRATSTRTITIPVTSSGINTTPPTGGRAWRSPVPVWCARRAARSAPARAGRRRPRSGC